MNKLKESFFDNQKKVYLALILVPLCLYVKSLFFGFSTLDEQWMIVKNTEELKDWANLSTVFQKPVAGLYYRPILTLSFMIDYHIGKLAPFSYHLTNLLLHLLSVVLFYRFLKLLNTANKPAFLLVLLFSIHPVLLHSVAWIPGRNDLLLTIFMLCASNTLTHYLLTGHIKQLVFHFLFFALALLTKENAFLLIVFFGILLYHFNSSKKTYIVFVLLWAAIITIWYFIRTGVVQSQLSAGGDLSTTLKNFVMAFLLFTGKTILPFQQSVFPTLKNASVIPGVITVAFLCFLYYKFGVKNKALSLTGLFLFAGMLAIPVWYGASSPTGEHYEHRLYLPLLGLLLFISQLNIDFNSSLFTKVMLAVIVAFTLKTFFRMNVYKDELSFIEAGTKEVPEYYLFHFQKGNKLFAKKDINGALKCFNTAAKMDPNRGQVYNSRANLYAHTQQYGKAIDDYKKAIQFMPGNPSIYMNKCITLYESGEIEQAMVDLDTMNYRFPGYITADIYEQTQTAWNHELLDKLNKQLQAQPSNAALYVKRAGIFSALQMNAEAFEDIKTACSIEPGNAQYKLYYNRLAPAQ